MGTITAPPGPGVRVPRVAGHHDSGLVFSPKHEGVRVLDIDRQADESSERACVASLVKLARAMRGLELPLELGYERLSALGSIRDAEPVSVTLLASAERVDPAAVSRTLDALEARGLIRRSADENDRRGVLIRTTAQSHYFKFFI